MNADHALDVYVQDDTGVDYMILTAETECDECDECNEHDKCDEDDGLLDVVCHFKTQATGFLIGDTEGILRGLTVDGVSIEGRDSVRIVR